MSSRFCDDDHDVWTELAQREDENGAKGLGHPRTQVMSMLTTDLVVILLVMLMMIVSA